MLGSPVGLKGEPVGQHRMTAEEAIAHGEALVRAGKRSQRMLEERKQKETEGKER